jgi:hypothetical protein
MIASTLLLCSIAACSPSTTTTVTVSASPAAPVMQTRTDPTCHHAAAALLDALTLAVHATQAYNNHQLAHAVLLAGRLQQATHGLRPIVPHCLNS